MVNVTVGAHVGNGTRRFRHRAKVVEALQFDGTDDGAAKLEAFAGAFVDLPRGGAASVEGGMSVRLVTGFGSVLVHPSDWVVRKAGGGFATISASAFVEQHEMLGA